MGSTIKYFCLFFLSVGIWAQESPSKEIRLEIESLVNATSTNNWDVVFDLTYPVIFAAQTREQVKEEMMSALDNEMFKIEFVPPTNMDFHYSAIKTRERPNADYFFVRHPLKMQIIYREPLDSTQQTLTVAAFEMRGFDAEMVSDSVFSFSTANSIIIGLRNEATEEKWRYLNYDTNIGVMGLVDEEIIEDVTAFKSEEE